MRKVRPYGHTFARFGGGFLCSSLKVFLALFIRIVVQAYSCRTRRCGASNDHLYLC
jgi:hypothetical protein